MHQKPKDSTAEVKRLQRCMNDLVSVLALPAVWIGSEPARILETFLDAVLAMLDLDFLYLRMKTEVDGESVEDLKHSLRFVVKAPDIRLLLHGEFGDVRQKWPLETRRQLGGQETSLLTLRLGIEDEIGIVLAGCHRADFPTQAERLLLGVATNQLVVEFQQFHLLSEQKRIASELEQRVAERTARLEAANAELRKEIADRRVVEDRLLKSEDLLKSSEARLRQVIDTIPTLTWSALPDGPSEFLSKRWHDYTGLSPEGALGWGWKSAIHPEDLPFVLEKRRKLFISGQPGEWEARLRRADGVYRWFLLRLAPLRDHEGTIVRWYGAAADIDDRKVAEEALRASETNLRLIVDSIPGLVCTMSPAGEVESVNRHYLDYFGKTLEEIQNWGTGDLMHPDDFPRVIDAYARSMATGTPYGVEAQLRRADGVYRWFQIRALPVRETAGRITGWYALLTDTHDRKQAEEELRASETHLRETENALRANERNLIQIINTIPTTAWSTRPDGYCEFLSDRWLNYAGFTYEEAVGWNWATALHPDDAEGLRDYWLSCLASGTPVDTEARIRRFDGVYRWFIFRANPFRDDSGNILKWYGTNIDIDERKRAEEALRNTQVELARMMRVMSIGQLTASIVHEVSQPLSGILTNASTCLRMLNSDPPNVVGARETAQRTIRDGKRATDVITRLRTLFSKKQINIEPVDLNEAAREVIALLSDELLKNSVTIQHRFSDRLALVNGDRVQLQQVLLNLLRNASDSMAGVDDRPRRLLISTVSDGNHATIHVQDSGIGFGPENAERLFESFFTTKQEGMGMGLSLSRSIVEAHRGHLWAMRNDGPGSTFAFSIPYDSGL